MATTLSLQSQGTESQGGTVALTLAALQNVLKRDPEAYREEFLQQWRHYEATLAIFRLSPQESSSDFQELVSFVAAVAPCYPDVVRAFPQQLIELLDKNAKVLDSDLRQCLCRALILIRNRDLLGPTDLLSLFFRLFRVPDKPLRELLYSHIVGDIRRLNQKHKSNAVNKTLQNFMYTMLGDANEIAAKRSMDVMMELYRRGIWQDERTVNVIAAGLFSPVAKIKVAALKFFLSSHLERPDDDGDGDDQDTYQDVLRRSEFQKKTKKRANQVKRKLKSTQAKEKRKQDNVIFNYSALHLLHDPQGLAEKLFKSLRAAANDRWEVQLMAMNLLSRLIGVHSLFILGFYSYLEKFLWPHKQDVTQILAYVAQACHDLVPGEHIFPLLLKIANNFVSDRSAPEVMAVGLNAIREMCVRCPLAMEEDLLHDLTEYKKAKDKSVVMASRSLIQLFRDVNPALLHRKDRGKPEEGDAPDAPVLQYGQTRPLEYVPGAELLSLYEELHPQYAALSDGDVAAAAAAAAEAGPSRATDGWESASASDDDSDDDTGWINVKHSDDEDDEPGAPGAEQAVVKDEVSAEDRVKRAVELSSSRVMTPADFERIKQLQLERKLIPAVGRKRKATASATDEHGVLEPDVLLPDRKKQRQTKDERLADVMKGRADRGQYNTPKGRMNENASTTNREKARKKNPMMLRLGTAVQAKRNRSLREKMFARGIAAKKRKSGKGGRK